MITFMQQIIGELLWQGGFSPHGFCLAYDDFAFNGMILGHRLIEIAYFMIPVQLLWAIYRRSTGLSLRPKNLNLVLGLFTGFILSCMLGHRIEEFNFTHAYYRLEAVWHIWTGLISMTTAVVMPFALRFEDRVPLEEARRLWHDHNNLVFVHLNLQKQFREHAADTPKAREIMARMREPTVPARFEGQVPTQPG